MLSPEHLQYLIASYGYWAVGVIIGLESMGIASPGEIVLVLAVLYAGAQSALSIWGVVASAVPGAILGDNVGYWLGRQFGYWLLLRYGAHVGLSDARIKLGQYLFLRHGGKVVLLGRSIAVLRALAAFLAGVNRMPWRDVLLAEAAGSILRASTFGLGAYVFGKALLQLTRPLATGLLIVGAVFIVIAVLFVRAREAEFQARAQRAFPGPLRRVG